MATNDAYLPADGGPDADLDTAATDYAGRLCLADARERRRLRDEFTTYCLPFARRLAWRYHGRGEAIEDLEQVARLGLVKAVNRYDPERGSFISFAVLTVRGEIRRHFRDKTWGVHVVRRMQNLGLQARQANATLTVTLARTPTTGEIAEHLSVSLADVQEALQSSAAYQLTSLNAPSAVDSGAEIGDVLGGPDPAFGAVDDQLTVARLMRLLPEREQRLLAMRFYGNYTQNEIAGVLGVSQMQVSRLLAAALGWLHEAMLSDQPPPRRVAARLTTKLPAAAGQLRLSSTSPGGRSGRRALPEQAPGAEMRRHLPVGGSSQCCWRHFGNATIGCGRVPTWSRPPAPGCRCWG